MHGLNKNKKDKQKHLYTAFTLTLVLFCFACTPQNKVISEAVPVRDEPVRELSEQGKQLYYYLALSDALASKDTAYLTEVVTELAKVDPNLELFQESASLMLRRKAPEQAATIAEQGLLLFPNDEFLVILLVNALADMEKTANAVDVLETHMKNNGKTPETIIELVRLFFKVGNLDKAEHYLSFLSPSSSPKAMYFHIHLRIQKNELAKAKKLLLAYIKLNPQAIEGYLDLGAIAENQRDYPLAIEMYKKASLLEPSNFNLWLRIIAVYLMAENPDEAMVIATSVPMPTEYAFQSIFLFADMGYPKQAEMLLDRKLPDIAHEERSLHMATIHIRSNSPLEAILKHVNEIGQENQWYSSALEYKINILLDFGEYEEAVLVSRHALRLFPEKEVFWYLKSFALGKAGELEQGKIVLQKAVKNFPESTDLLFSLAMAEEQLGNSKKAMKIAENIIKKNPRHAMALNHLGYSLAEQGKDLQRALELLSIAVEEDSTNVYYRDSLAWAQYKLGKYAEAWANMQLCLEYGIEEAIIWEHYGDIAAALELWGEAEFGYSEAIKRDPENAQEISAKLQKIQKKL